MRTEHLDVRATNSLLLHARVAVVVAKYAHTIVERNRLRRRLRELARTVVIPSLGGMDVLIRALPSAYGATFRELLSEAEEVVLELSGKRARP